MKIFKTIATLGIIGGIVYVIHRSYKTYKSETEGGISGEDIRLKRDIEEAKKTVAEHEAKKVAHMMDDEECEMNILDEEKPEDDFDEEAAVDELDDSLNTDGIFMERKEEKLRHDPDSKEAIDQYKLMIMSDFESDSDIYDTLLKTWNETFIPVNERDGTILLHIWEERCRFFGEHSIYSNKATMAEVFIFYANKLSYDYGVDPLYALRSIFFVLGINKSIGVTEIGVIMRTLTHHDFVNKDNMYGMFGLPMDIYENRIRKYPQVILSIDNNEDIGFDMEYNVFCDLYGDHFVDNWFEAYEDRVKGVI